MTLGAREYWLVEAMGAELAFQIVARGEAEFIPVSHVTGGPSETPLGTVTRDSQRSKHAARVTGELIFR